MNKSIKNSLHFFIFLCKKDLLVAQKDFKLDIWNKKNRKLWIMILFKNLINIILVEKIIIISSFRLYTFIS